MNELFTCEGFSWWFFVITKSNRYNKASISNKSTSSDADVVRRVYFIWMQCDWFIWQTNVFVTLTIVYMIIIISINVIELIFVAFVSCVVCSLLSFHLERSSLFYRPIKICLFIHLEFRLLWRPKFNAQKIPKWNKRSLHFTWMIGSHIRSLSWFRSIWFDTIRLPSNTKWKWNHVDILCRIIWWGNRWT